MFNNKLEKRKIFFCLYFLFIFIFTMVLCIKDDYGKRKLVISNNDLTLSKIYNISSEEINKTNFIKKKYKKGNYIELLKKLDDIDSINNEKKIDSLKDKKLIAFTFDDGPSIYTNKLLDNLDKYNAKVTFFVVGSRLNQYQDVLKREFELENQIGNHTYNHPNLVKLNDEEIIKEINGTSSLIEKIIGIKPTILRPPYGSVNDNIKNITNMNIILWDIDTEDWKYKDSERIYNYIISNAQDGSIILLHDLYETSVDGALQAMEKLYQDGYKFVTIDEMVKLKNIELSKTKSYYNFKK